MKRKRERQPTGQDSPTVIYSDALLRILVVVEHRGELWLCPRRPGGWSSRQRLQMTPEARQQQLRPARDVTPGWLCINTGIRCEISTEANAAGQSRPVARPAVPSV